MDGHEVLKLANGVRMSTMVVCEDGDGNLYLIDKYCVPYQKKMLVLPGGKIEPGEDEKVAAKREFEEESGMKVQILGDLGEVAILPGYIEAKTVGFWGRIVGTGKRGGDDLDRVTVRKIGVFEVMEMLAKQEFEDARTEAFLWRYKSSRALADK